MLKWLAKSLLILIALVVVSFILPVASFWLVRDPIGDQICFWAGPWVVAFWSVTLYVLVGARFWRGADSVEEWKERHGSFLWRHFKTTAWMFAALLFSYLIEFGVLWHTRSPALMVVGTYSPVGFTILWSGIRG